MSGSTNKIFEFGPFRLDCTERLLLRDGQPVPLTLRAFDLLQLLVENRGHLVEKNQLMNQVWAGTFVEEGNVKATVSMLPSRSIKSASSPSALSSARRTTLASPLGSTRPLALKYRNVSFPLGPQNRVPFGLALPSRFASKSSMFLIVRSTLPALTADRERFPPASKPSM